MRILLDLQGAQTESRFRGIGRYSISLASAIIRNASNHNVCLLLNGAFQDSAIEIRQKFSRFIRPEDIYIFDMSIPVSEYDARNVVLAQIAEKTREYFIQQLKPDAILTMSLFEGYLDDAVTSIGTLCPGDHHAVILYDLIPFLNPESHYSIEQKAHYYRKIESLKRAGLLLAISSYSRQCAIKYLGISPDRVINISTAVEDIFKPVALHQDQLRALRQCYGITRDVILYVPGGFEERKNFSSLITAYGMLPHELRTHYQLVIASKFNEEIKYQLNEMRKTARLMPSELLLIGYVPDEDLVKLYNLATLFVFPSTAEGFGLPLLEAMACGAPVIGSNASSIPEVIACSEALFDPSEPKSIVVKMRKILENKEFRQKLSDHMLKQAQNFSWDYSAKIALEALEGHLTKRSKVVVKENSFVAKKLRLAFVSPLPPEQTGISDYSVQLLPELMRYFEIELIVKQTNVELSPTLMALPRHSVDWFVKNGADFDRIVYHMGNSYFHTHMLDLLWRHPGAIILHEFFISSMLAYEELSGNRLKLWTEALFYSHGYAALHSRFKIEDMGQMIDIYPCNLSVLQDARGIIVHSQHTKQLADKWYGRGVGDDWIEVPLLGIPHLDLDRVAARQALGIRLEAFVVCSFGLVDPKKLTHRLLSAWLLSSLSKDQYCELIMVGSNHGGCYGAELLERIHGGGYSDQIRVTGWVDRATYELYLQAADVCVQLRAISRGEVSRAVLDCLSYGLAVIVNAHGSMSQLPLDAVWMLPDDFADNELTIALEELYRDRERRHRLAQAGRQFILTERHPKICARLYAEAIEKIYQSAEISQQAFFKSILSTEGFHKVIPNMECISQVLASPCRPKPRQKQLLVDVSSIVHHDLKAGIERVVRAQLLELIKAPPVGFRVEPVYLSKEDNHDYHYRYAQDYAFKILDISSYIDAKNRPVDVSSGDIFYAVDFAPYDIIAASKKGLFKKWRALGVQLNILIHDLLPVFYPQFFPEGVDAVHIEWLKEISYFADRLVGVSGTVIEETYKWLEENPPSRAFPLKLCAAPLGADMNASASTSGLPEDAVKILQLIKHKIIFLMVGTIEPRKGHLQVLDAFDRLWSSGYDVKLIIVGEEGWISLEQVKRRTIPEIVERLSSHRELNKRLFWIRGASDEYLQAIYTTATCLIVASEGEGFGLPLIEAAQYHLPIIVRDLPVFREVAQDGAYYFRGLDGQDLAEAITEWLVLYKNDQMPLSGTIQKHTWAQNVERLKEIFLGCCCHEKLFYKSA